MLATLFKTRLWHRVFSCEFYEIFNKTIFTERLQGATSTQILNFKITKNSKMNVSKKSYRKKQNDCK